MGIAADITRYGSVVRAGCDSIERQAGLWRMFNLDEVIDLV